MILESGILNGKIGWKPAFIKVPAFCYYSLNRKRLLSYIKLYERSFYFRKESL